MLALMVDDPSAIEDASEGGLGLLQRVENASDLAQPMASVKFQGVCLVGSGDRGNHMIWRTQAAIAIFTYLQNNKSLHHP